MPLQNPRLSRLLSTLIGCQLLLSGVPVTAQTMAAMAPAATVTLAPDFTPPGADHCQRPMQTREVLGQPSLAERAGRPMRHPSAPTAGGLGKASRSKHESADYAAMPATMPSPASSPVAVAVAEPQASPEVVTAGVVDDNADFGEYLAFRERTQVKHLVRDVNERYLLQVNHATGRGVPDAQVQVQAANGATTWARTDTAGRVWLHPNAFDAGRSAVYEVTVRHAGQQGQGFLQRGQKSAVEVRLDQPGEIAQRARLDLVFMVDATGSMADEIGKLKASLRSIADEVARLPSQPDLCFGLVAYRDTSDTFVLRSHDFTNDLDAFQDVLDRLQAAGGGDYPEAMSEALHETVHRMSWRGEGTTRMVLLLADAPPQMGQDRPPYDEAMLAALGKGIKLFSVGASGLDPQGEVVLRQLAQYTGGRFVFLTYDRAEQPASGPGRETVHDVRNYSVDTLDQLITRLVRDELAPLNLSNGSNPS